jgi:hypothetical protein
MPVENILPPDADTFLLIDVMGQFYAQARDLEQKLTPIKQSSQLRRSWNGDLLDLSNPLFRKYATTVTCTDINSWPLDNLWPGMPITVYCAIRLGYLAGNPGSPARTVMDGSMYTQGHFVFYRPVLSMLVSEPSNQTYQEWKASNSTGFYAEEV